MSKYVLSTMTNSVSYRTYRMIGDATNNKNQSLLPVPEENPVIIRGGANRPSLKLGFGESSEDINGNILWTARGVVTVLSDEDYDRVKDHWLFKKHLEGGYLEVLEKDITGNHKEVAKIATHMEGQDPGAQLTKDTVAQRIKVKTPTKEIGQEY